MTTWTPDDGDEVEDFEPAISGRQFAWIAFQSAVAAAFWSGTAFVIAYFVVPRVLSAIPLGAVVAAVVYAAIRRKDKAAGTLIGAALFWIAILLTVKVRFF